MCILCVFYMCAAIGVIINDDDDDRLVGSSRNDAFSRVHTISLVQRTP